MPCEDSLRELVLFSLEKRWLRERLRGLAAAYREVINRMEPGSSQQSNAGRQGKMDIS